MVRKMYVKLNRQTLFNRVAVIFFQGLCLSHAIHFYVVAVFHKKIFSRRIPFLILLHRCPFQTFFIFQKVWNQTFGFWNFTHFWRKKNFKQVQKKLSLIAVFPSVTIAIFLKNLVNPFFSPLQYNMCFALFHILFRSKNVKFRESKVWFQTFWKIKNSEKAEKVWNGHLWIIPMLCAINRN